MSMRTTEIEVRDPNTNTIPIDVRFDPETEIGELNHYLINQDGNEITITLEMAASLLTAIKRLELSRPQRHSGRWEDNFKTVAEPVQEPVAWDLAEKVRRDLDRQSCPGAYMDIAVESIVNHCAAPVQPLKQEPVAHMYPSDLEKFETNETYAYAYSVAVGNPDERSVPLYTDPPRREWVEPSDEQIIKLEYDCFAEICKQDNPTGEKLTALFIRRLLKLSKELNNG